ncbi:MAG: hypothetical protein ACO36I_20195 [Candidatus Latescibacterota bacterium]
MHLKPINRQGKKRRKLTTKPVLSCESFWGSMESQMNALSTETQVAPKKDKAAA